MRYANTTSFGGMPVICGVTMNNSPTPTWAIRSWLQSLGLDERHLQDLPAQGVGVIVKLRMRRWRCHNKACERQAFEALYVSRTLPFIAFASVEKCEGRLTRVCRSCSRISSRMMTSH